ncbi:S1 RNA-binding domain-containing protein, partial [Salmonella enterica]|uniref:S1 RNA-binding domain-containing protein n=1 Tax=Salmonella enterica TaxID=28901 RepID=UPI0032B39ECF
QAIQRYKKADMVKAQVLDVDIEKERISLGIKQLEGDPFAAAGNINKGDIVTCTVTASDVKGISVSIEGGLMGYIRKSELSRDRAEQRPER